MLESLIINVLSEASRPLAPEEIAARLPDIKPATIRQSLRRAVKKGSIAFDGKTHRRYFIP